MAGSRLFRRAAGPATAERTVGAGEEVAMGVVDKGLDIGVAGVALHHRAAAARALDHDPAEGLVGERAIAQPRREARVLAIRSVTMAAASMIAAKAALGRRIHPPVDDR